MATVARKTSHATRTTRRRRRNRGILILRGGGNVLLHGQIGQKGFDFPAAHLLGVALVVEQDVALAQRVLT